MKIVTSIFHQIVFILIGRIFAFLLFSFDTLNIFPASAIHISVQILIFSILRFLLGSCGYPFWLLQIAISMFLIMNVISCLLTTKLVVLFPERMQCYMRWNVEIKFQSWFQKHSFFKKGLYSFLREMKNVFKSKARM